MVPVAVAALAVGGSLIATSAAAEPTLPKKNAEQLLTAVASAHVDGLSGTVSETANLGLPTMPSNERRDSSDFSSLLTGSHTLKVWTSGQDKSRVSLLGSYGESDLIRNGNQAWVWSSADKKAVQTTYVGGKPAMRQGEVPATPQEAAQQALAEIGPTTATSVGRNATVAGRSAYELVLTPKDQRSLVADVSIAVDAKTSVPLRVQVRADGQADPAFSVGFTSVDFSQPAAKNFQFTPPAGATVEHHTIGGATNKAHPQKSSAPAQPKVVGKGWTSVVVGSTDQLTKTGQQAGEYGQLIQSLPKVSGSWGSGRLLQGSLFSAVITQDGRVAAGAVRPALLYSALQK
ncbi:hypothetical protein FOE78_06345 [Microlunatus elymi]|uniref:Outer membrane lipoprotein-sorting protein n=1 Tax=Microlunatus elymi TaxID=2596828 RepID=A0A516Q5A2_9ACTN|nr:hypothetical protein FOE78_06345 [Microlunatus elymi]